MPSKIAFHTLGCKFNQAETEKIKEKAILCGFEIIDFKDNWDICVINTCTVTALADKKSKQIIRHALRTKQGKVYVTGCLSQIDPQEIKNIDPNLIVFSKDDKFFLKENVIASPPLKARDEAIHPNKIRTNLITQNGCNNLCSYCIIPFARGEEKDRSFGEIILDAENIIHKGIKEIVLTGINTGSFKKLPYLLNVLSQYNELLRIRISSLEPLLISDDLIAEIKNNNKVCKHFHIPLQSGDNSILKAMNRNYTIDQYKNVIHKIRHDIPDSSFSTDIMVGFPGESEDNFNNTIKSIEKIYFNRIHIFRYSKRKGTAAEKLKNQLNPSIIAKRSSILHDLRNKTRFSSNKKLIDKIEPVLIEQKDKKTGLLEGLTSSYVRVFTEGDERLIGNIVPVKITEAYSEFVKGLRFNVQHLPVLQ